MSTSFLCHRSVLFVSEDPGKFNNAIVEFTHGIAYLAAFQQASERSMKLRVGESMGLREGMGVITLEPITTISTRITMDTAQVIQHHPKSRPHCHQAVVRLSQAPISLVVMGSSLVTLRRSRLTCAVIEGSNSPLQP